MRILHVFRTPVGGLFRHVRDLARGQAARGHEVGLLCDSSTGGAAAAQQLAQAAEHCRLGIARIPISRLPGVGDLAGVRQTLAEARRVKPDIIHCHGAKGGLYGRLAARLLSLPAVYTPHGGSLHYAWDAPAGLVFLSAEWLLARLGGALCFVCDFEKCAFDAKIGIGANPWRVVHNGLWPEEFSEAPLAAGAADVVFIGEMRDLKGVDVLIEALGLCASEHKVTACLVGDGPRLAAYRAQVAAAALDGLVTFAGRLPAAEALSRGRLLVMPSRAESFPYVVLEAAAAGRPVIATAVGGIPEALPAEQLVPAGDAAALARRILAAIVSGRSLAALGAASRAAALRFRAEAMVDEVLALYRSAGAN